MIEITCSYDGAERIVEDCNKRVKAAKQRKQQGLDFEFWFCAHCEPERQIPADYEPEQVENVCSVCGRKITGRGKTGKCRPCALKENRDNE